MSLHPAPVPPASVRASLDPGPQFLSLPGARVAFDVLGAGGAPVSGGSASASPALFVLVNGYQRNRLDFRAFRKRLASLAPHVVTVALDNRGVGETEIEPQGGAASEPLTVERMARDVGAVARAVLSALAPLGVERYALLGVSMGGMIAQALAAEDPLVNALVLVSTTAGGHGRVWPARAQAEGTADRLVYLPWPREEASMRRRMERYFGPRFLAQSPLLVSTLVKNMVKAYSAAGVAPDPELGSRLQFSASAGFDGTGVLAHIACPTLVVTGSHDSIIPKENAYFLAAHLPRASLVEYPDVGHLILVEEPERFAVDVANFLG